MDSASQQRACAAYYCSGVVIANAALTCWLLGRPKLWSYFSPFVDQSSPDYVSWRGRDRSLQRRFPIVDILFCSGDIRDRSAKLSKIAPKKHVFCHKFFWMEDPQFLDLAFKTAPISDHVAKFHGDRARDRGDLALNKKKERKERKKQQQNIRPAFALSRNGRT